MTYAILKFECPECGAKLWSPKTGPRCPDSEIPEMENKILPPKEEPDATED